MPPTHPPTTTTTTPYRTTQCRSAARAHGEVVAPYLAGCFIRIFPGSSSKPDSAPALALLKEVLDELA
jgi:hypothetical protein